MGKIWYFTIDFCSAEQMVNLNSSVHRFWTPNTHAWIHSAFTMVCIFHSTGAMPSYSLYWLANSLTCPYTPQTAWKLCTLRVDWYGLGWLGLSMKMTRYSKVVKGALCRIVIYKLFAIVLINLNCIFFSCYMPFYIVPDPFQLKGHFLLIKIHSCPIQTRCFPMRTVASEGAWPQVRSFCQTTAMLGAIVLFGFGQGDQGLIWWLADWD